MPAVHRRSTCQLRKLDAVPGVSQRAAEQILVEIGSDVARFPSAAHLASWARICPGNNESAGKRKSGRTGRGNPWLRGALVEAAWAAARTRHTYLSAEYHRLAARRGGKRAAVAVAHTLLTIIYHLLRSGTDGSVRFQSADGVRAGVNHGGFASR